MSWYVLKTKPRQEGRAVTHLQNQSITTYCPWLIRKDGSREPLFTSYLFVRFDSPETFAESFVKVRSTRGVQQFVRYGDCWARAEQDLIDQLQYRENGFRAVPLFKRDQEVMIKDGPFKGLEAVYLCADGEQRAMVMLTILNRKTAIKIEEKLLKAV
jgi:transcriptional antiterminator RfaH